MYIDLQGRPMTHLDDGRLHALMDEELDDADALAVQVHLEACEACKRRMAELEERSALVAQALGRLDTADPADGARDAVLERLASSPSADQVGPPKPLESPESPPSVSRGRTFSMPLARAAILVLLLGGLATALPASPVRSWIAAGWELATGIFGSSDSAETPVGPAGEATTQDGGDGAQSDVPRGVGLDVAGEAISIVLREIGPGTLIIVRLVPGGAAGAFADDPATFRTAQGRIEVIGASDRVFVDLPQDATSASIEVNGGIYVTKEGDRIETTGPIEARTAEEIRLRVP